MARSVSGTFLAAQQSATNTPYCKLVFTSKDGGTTVDLSTDGTYGNRILLNITVNVFMKASALSQTNDKDSLLVMSNLDDLILNTLYPSTLAKKRAKSQFKRQREKREYLEYVDEIRPGLCSKIDDVERWLDSVPEIHEDRSNEWVGSHKHECREVLIHL
ncbi:hypothetical protein LCGC14_1235040, partial [marine sediment metagenome]